MIVNEEKATVTGTLMFEEQVQMQLDPAAIAMHIRNMIRMYANPRLAALREYTSNARDSHKAAGYTGPVEVTLPTALHPFLTVRDYGIGLDKEGVKGFGQFGRSTKNDNNEYIGGFGLGSKSGLAVASQFTVIAVKDGKKNTVVVGRDEKNNPSLGFLPEQDTDERNGVTIQIPSSGKHEEWQDVTSGNTFIGWEPGSIVINGKAPALSVHNTDQFSPLKSGWLSKRESVNRRFYGFQIMALVHGVYYSIPSENLRGVNGLGALQDSVLNIPNGSVDILPSRDDLEWTDRTRAAVTDIAQKMIQEVITEYRVLLNDAPSYRDARRIAAKMEELGLPGLHMDWKGVKFTWNKDNTVVTQTQVKSSSTAASGYQIARNAYTVAAITTMHEVESYLVVEAQGTANSSYYKKNEQYHAASGETVPFILSESPNMPTKARVVITDKKVSELPEGFVLSFTKIISETEFIRIAKETRTQWAKDRAAQRAANKAANPTPKVSDRSVRVVRSVYSSNTFSLADRTESEVLAANLPVVVIHEQDKIGSDLLAVHTDGSSNKSSYIMSLIGEKAGEFTFICLPRNQKATNLTVPYTTITDWVKLEVGKVQKADPIELAVRSYRESRRATYRGYTISELHESAIKNIKNDDMRKWMTFYVKNKNLSAVERVAAAYPELVTTKVTASDFDPVKRYPLLPQVSVGFDKDSSNLAVDYINLIDATR